MTSQQLQNAATKKLSLTRNFWQILEKMASFKIEWRKSTKKDLRKIPQPEVRRIIEAVDQLSEDPAAALVTSTDNYGYSDPWHYDTAGYLDLGEKFAEAMNELRK